jgi:hypothetical protein
VRAKNFVLAAALPLIFFPYNVHAQWIGQIQTESDWETLLNQGYFDYNSYQLYRELSEGTVVKDTMEYVQTILGNPVSDIVSSVGNANISQKVSQHRAYLRSGQRVQDGNNSGYVLLSSTSRNVNIEYKGRNDNSFWDSERRSIEFTGERFNVTAGNYTANIGSGLGIGRYDYRPLGISKDSLGSNFLFPDNSYYNGAKIEIDNRYTLLQSSKKFLSVRKDLFGGAFSIPINDYKIGLTAFATRLSTSGNHRTLGEGSIYFSNPDIGLSSEIGYAESGAGAVCEINRRSYDIKFWHYDDSFINPQSSGMAYPDYVSFNDPRFPVSFRQPQAGESGLAVRRNAAISRLTLVGWVTAWKRSPHDPVSLDNSLGARLPLGDGVDLTGRYSERLGRSLARTLGEFGLNFRKSVEAATLVSLWVDGNATNKAKSYAHIFVSVPISERFLASARLRSYFNGKLEYFVEERTALSDHFSLKATYRWQDTLGRESGPLYLIMESSI